MSAHSLIPNSQKIFDLDSNTNNLILPLLFGVDIHKDLNELMPLIGKGKVTLYFIFDHLPDPNENYSPLFILNKNTVFECIIKCAEYPEVVCGAILTSDSIAELYPEREIFNPYWIETSLCEFVYAKRD